MAIAIRCNNSVKGIDIGNEIEVKITQFADDTTLILDGSKDSILNAVKILEDFGSISGLNLNIDKSVFLKIGSLKDNNEQIIPECNYRFSKGPVKFLGIMISLDKKDLFELNFEPQFKKLSSILNIWSQRDLTPIGKITIIKTLALSQLTYLFSVLPSPPLDFMKKIEKLLFKFIWNDKQDRVKLMCCMAKKKMVV